MILIGRAALVKTPIGTLLGKMFMAWWSLGYFSWPAEKEKAWWMGRWRSILAPKPVCFLDGRIVKHAACTTFSLASAPRFHVSKEFASFRSAPNPAP